eukprot:g14015.t1
MSHDRTVIRHAVDEIGFGFLTDDEIRKLSVKRITSPVTFDTLNNPLPGGLYDPVFGPVDRMMMCETCGQDQKNCPGHMGHIELAVSVYHPILFGALYKLLRAKCFSCHKLRLSKTKTRVAAVKLMLVDAGRTQEALELDATLLGYLREDAKGADHNILEGTSEEKLASASKYRDHVLSCIEEDLESAQRAEWCGGHNRQLRRQLVDGLIKSMGACKRCENCGAFSPNIRKDGSNKLFQVPLSDKMRIANQSCNAQIVSAVQRRDPGKAEEDDGDDSDPMSEVDDNNSEDGDDADGNGDGASSAEVVAGVPLAAAQAAAAQPAANTGQSAHKFMPPIEVELQMQQLWKHEAETLDLIFSSGAQRRRRRRRAWAAEGGDGGGADASLVVANGNGGGGSIGDSSTGGIYEGYRLFFVRALAVPPPRFRPPMHMGDMVAEHPQNVYLQKVLNLNESLKNAQSLKGEDLASALTTWVELQTTVNCYMDSSKDPRGLKDTPPGLRQVLEKKEGLFRKHMMGKRVNYACRSVISPDPYLGTTEIGIPLRFAKELTYPQPVADWNVEALRELVENGAGVYPGANIVEDAQGRMTMLDRLSDLRRKGLAARLLSTPGQKVWRHLRDGDCMLVNRQPTLHKPGIMAHRVRVLRNPGYQTIRMHYANCNTYNADFDGDEINCHLPQNELAKAEANLLAFTDEQYLVPTNGKPLRGLIQDHVDAGVKMCSKDCFFTRGEYQQLLYQALSGLPGLEIVPPSDDITTLTPAILKPQERWTGKQVMSTILKHLTAGLPQLNLDGKSKTPSVAFGEAEQEHVIVFREGELLQGVLDKAAFGSTEFGVVHAVHELYGPTAAGKLLTALGRVLTIFLQLSGHTCGIEDLTLTSRAESSRRDMIRKSLGMGQRSMRELLTVQDGGGKGQNGTANVGSAAENGNVPDEAPLVEEEVEDIRQRTAAYLLGEGRDHRLAEIDRHMQSSLAPVSSDIIKACLPKGQAKPFPQNAFSLMVLTGAKGSMVNHSQISCALGQQALEGRRVPVMVSGKSLPSFQAFEPSPRANGFITDRFLTGIRPQEYYFHCMAGREGLVDTAVKTSRSGYLQRCLVKHLEELKVGYDNTVRDGEGCVHQFLYGEDGVDTTQSKYLSPKQLGFLAQNYHALRHKYGITPSFLADTGFDTRRALLAHAGIAAAQERADKAAASAGGGGGGVVGGALVFVAGEQLLARRRAVLEGDEGWGQAELLDGWHPAEVVKIRNAGTKAALYTVRYNDDKAMGKKMPVTVEPEEGSSSSSDDEKAAAPSFSTSSSRRRKRPRCLLRKHCDEKLADPVLSTLSVNKDLGCVSEAFQKSLQAFLDTDPPSLTGSSGKAGTTSSATSEDGKVATTGGSKKSSPASLKEAFKLLLWVKYMRCLAAPGETVGSIAAQSVGEPSTQMTLNTFHLAGHGGANVTLGIPRLREIIMTAAKTLKTPSMVVPLRDGADRPTANAVALRLSRLSLSQLLHNNGGVVVRERLVKGDSGLWERHYAVCLKLFPSVLIKQAFQIDFKAVCRKISAVFVPNLLAAITADLRRTGTKLSQSGGMAANVHAKRGKNDGGGDEEEDDPEGERSAELSRTIRGAKKASKAEAEYESDDEDEEQGTLKFGKHKEQASYGGMDEEEKAIWKAMSGKKTDGGVLDDDDEDENGDVESGSDGDGGARDGGGGQDDGKGDKEYFQVPSNLSGARHFKGITKNKKTCEVEVTVRLPSSMRRLLMVGLAESAAAKTMVRSHKGIRGAFVVDTTGGGKSGLAVQLEGSDFETVWQLKEGWTDGPLNLNKLTSNDVWAVCQTYGVEAARASIVTEIINVFGAYGIAVDPRHLGLVADHMTFDGGYRPLNRAGMADFSSPCLQMSFETTTDFMAKAAVARSSDRLKSPSARIVMGRVGEFGTGMFDLRQPAEFGGIETMRGAGIAVGGSGGGDE